MRKLVRTVMILVFIYTCHADISLAANGRIMAYEVDKFVNPYISETRQQPKSELKAVGFSGQTAYISFTLANKRNDNLDNLVITLTKGDDFLGNKGDAELFLVHAWEQSATFNVSQNGKSRFTLVPELLIKNDQLQITPDNKSLQISSAEDVHTTISSGSFRYFCLKISLPIINADTDFVLHLNVVKEMETLLKLPVKISVLPHKLPESDKIKAVYFFGGFDDKQVPGYYSSEELLKQLSDIRAHGFKGITLKGDDPTQLRRLAKLALDQNVGSYVVLLFTGGNDDDLLLRCYRALQEVVPKVYIMTMNEPNNEPELDSHRKKRNIWKKQGVSVYAPIRLEWYEKIWNDAPLDWVNYSFKENVHDELEKIRGESGSIKTYYWQMYMEMPVLNRYLSGFYLYYSGLDGIFPYAYRHEFENDQPFAGDLRTESNKFRQLKYYYMTYPSAAGPPVSTLQWEAFIEGDNDLRYCYLIEELTTALQQKGQKILAQDIKKQFQTKLRRVSQFYLANRLKPYQRYEMKLSRDIEELREWILDIWQKHSDSIAVRQGR